MTQEEKYKEALLEARAVLEPCLKYSKGKVREALDSIDNELKRFESEDERIRKELKEAFEAYDIESKWNGIPIRSIFAWLEKQKEQKPVSISCGHENDAEWGEEDKKMLLSIINAFRNGTVSTIGQEQWLKNLPKRINPQPKPEWSEEDEDMLNSCISSIEEAKENRYAYKETDGDTSYDHEIDWLKSLCPQYHGDVTMTEAYKMGLEAGKASSWKPSEEQMKAFEDAMTYIPEFYKPKSNLASLLRDLKKL